MILTNRGVMDEAGEQFVAYFLPTDETMAKRRSDQDEGKDYTDDAEYEYKMARLESVIEYFQTLIVYRAGNTIGMLRARRARVMRRTSSFCSGWT